MKMFLLFVGISMCSSLNAEAQEVIGNYEMSYFEKEFELMGSEPDAKGNFTFYVMGYSQERPDGLVSIMIENKDIEDFKSALTEARNVYVQWKQTATENKVTDLDKEIEVPKSKVKAAFHYGSSWNFDFNVNLKARYRITNGKDLLIISNRSKLQSSSNRYIDHDGFFLIFTSVEEVDTLLSKIGKEPVVEFFAAKKSQEDIFKQE